MTTLPNFPRISQRDSDKNADFDCVPASLAMCLQYLTGRHYTAGEIKDAVYGAGYVGGTAAQAYVEYCNEQGIKLEPINGTGLPLVQDLKNEIQAGHPCLITEPDPYAAGWSHVCAAYAFDDNGVTVVDPWIDQPVTKSNDIWAQQLQFNQIWVCSHTTGRADAPGRTTWVSEFQQSQAEATWNATTKGAAIGGNGAAHVGMFEAGQTPSYTTGIAKAWQHEYMNGHNYGPPVGYEYRECAGKPLTDWDGNPIVQQNFLGGRCEWNPQTSEAHWYRWGE